MENCWKLTGKPRSKLSSNQTNNTQQQHKPGNQGSGGNKKGKEHGKGKKDKGKCKVHETHVTDMAMVIDIDSETELGRCDNTAEDTSDVT